MIASFRGYVSLFPDFVSGHSDANFAYSSSLSLARPVNPASSRPSFTGSTSILDRRGDGDRAALPPTLLLVYRFMHEPPGREFNQILIHTVRIQLLFSVLLSLGLLF